MDSNLNITNLTKHMNAQIEAPLPIAGQNRILIISDTEGEAYGDVYNLDLLDGDLCLLHSKKVSADFDPRIIEAHCSISSDDKFLVAYQDHNIVLLNINEWSVVREVDYEVPDIYETGRKKVLFVKNKIVYADLEGPRRGMIDIIQESTWNVERTLSEQNFTSFELARDCLITADDRRLADWDVNSWSPKIELIQDYYYYKPQGVTNGFLRITPLDGDKYWLGLDRPTLNCEKLLKALPKLPSSGYFLSFAVGKYLICEGRNCTAFINDTDLKFSIPVPEAIQVVGDNLFLVVTSDDLIMYSGTGEVMYECERSCKGTEFKLVACPSAVVLFYLKERSNEYKAYQIIKVD